MGKRVVWIVTAVVVAFGGLYFYHTYRQRKQLADGDVQCVGCMSPSEEAKFQKEDTGDTPDAGSKAAASGGNTAAGASTGQAAKFNYPAANSTSGAAPASDSLNANAPNGMKFGGGGVYQWYRQGNLTWRINTQTGASCIVYATMEEWRKPIVMQHGCGNTT